MSVDRVIHQRSQGPPTRSIGKPGQLSTCLRGVLLDRLLGRGDTARGPQQRQRLGQRLVIGHRAREDLPQPVGGRPCFGECEQYGQGVHTFPQVGSGQLARLVGIALDIDDVITDLEYRADDPADASQTLDLILVGTGERRAELPGSRDQAGGFLRNNFQIVRDGIVATFCTFGLAHLPGHQEGEGLSDDSDRIRSQLRHQPRGRREQIISGEDRDVVAPAGVGRRGTPTHLGLIHDIVVIQGGQVH